MGNFKEQEKVLLWGIIPKSDGRSEEERKNLQGELDIHTQEAIKIFKKEPSDLQEGLRIIMKALSNPETGEEKRKNLQEGLRIITEMIKNRQPGVQFLSLPKEGGRRASFRVGRGVGNRNKNGWRKNRE